MKPANCCFHFLKRSTGHVCISYRDEPKVLPWYVNAALQSINTTEHFTFSFLCNRKVFFKGTDVRFPDYGSLGQSVDLLGTKNVALVLRWVVKLKIVEMHFTHSGFY